MYKVIIKISYYTTISNGNKVEVNRNYAVNGIENLVDVTDFTCSLMREALEDYASALHHSDINYLTANVYNIDEEDF